MNLRNRVPRAAEWDRLPDREEETGSMDPGRGTVIRSLPQWRVENYGERLLAMLVEAMTVTLLAPSG